jgi:hypothetical protein
MVLARIRRTVTITAPSAVVRVLDFQFDFHILQHSGNPFYPAPWFSRNYGFFSPTPVWLEDRQLQKPSPTLQVTAADLP